MCPLAKYKLKMVRGGKTKQLNWHTVILLAVKSNVLYENNILDVITELLSLF